MYVPFYIKLTLAKYASNCIGYGFAHFTAVLIHLLYFITMRNNYFLADFLFVQDYFYAY